MPTNKGGWRRIPVRLHPTLLGNWEVWVAILHHHLTGADTGIAPVAQGQAQDSASLSMVMIGDYSLPAVEEALEVKGFHWAQQAARLPLRRTLTRQRADQAQDLATQCNSQDSKEAHSGIRAQAQQHLTTIIMTRPARHTLLALLRRRRRMASHRLCCPICRSSSMRMIRRGSMGPQLAMLAADTCRPTTRMEEDIEISSVHPEPRMCLSTKQGKSSCCNRLS